MMVWGFCSTQAFGPKVVTGHGPCSERVLLWGEAQGRGRQSAERHTRVDKAQTVLNSPKYF